MGKFSPAYNKVFKKYLSQEWDEHYEEVTEEGLEGEEVKKKYRRPPRLPMACEFAIQIGVDEETIKNWADKGRDYSYALSRAETEEDLILFEYYKFFVLWKKLKNLQKYILTRYGLSGAFKSNFAIFISKNLTDMRDKQEIDLNADITTKVVKVPVKKKVGDPVDISKNNKLED